MLGFLRIPHEVVFNKRTIQKENYKEWILQLSLEEEELEEEEEALLGFPLIKSAFGSDFCEWGKDIVEV